MKSVVKKMKATQVTPTGLNISKYLQYG